MRSIQQVHWKLEMDYIGHPYYVGGNAILHALGRHLPHEVHQHLHASAGIFVPGQLGTFPETHSRSGFFPNLEGGLRDVETYDDLFLFRRPSHSWLLDSRARDALNTHDIRVQSGHPAPAFETIVGRPRMFGISNKRRNGTSMRTCTRTGTISFHSTKPFSTGYNSVGNGTTGTERRG